MNVELDDSHPVLLVLDTQSLFTSPDGPFANQVAGTTIESLNPFMHECRKLNIPIVFSRYLLRDDLSDAGLLSNLAEVQAGYFCASSEWTQLDARVQVEASDLQVHRNRPSAFFGGDLESLLHSYGWDLLLLAGLSVNNAISATAREAFALDFPTLIIKECTGAAPWESELETYFEILNTWTAEVATTQNVITRLQNRCA